MQIIWQPLFYLSIYSLGRYPETIFPDNFRPAVETAGRAPGYDITPEKGVS